MAEKEHESGDVVEMNTGMVHISVPSAAVIDKCMDAHLRLVGGDEPLLSPRKKRVAA